MESMLISEDEMKQKDAKRQPQKLQAEAVQFAAQFSAVVVDIPGCKR